MVGAKKLEFGFVNVGVCNEQCLIRHKSIIMGLESATAGSNPDSCNAQPKFKLYTFFPRIQYPKLLKQNYVESLNKFYTSINIISMKLVFNLY